MTTIQVGGVIWGLAVLTISVLVERSTGTRAASQIAAITTMALSAPLALAYLFDD